MRRGKKRRSNQAIETWIRIGAYGANIIAAVIRIITDLTRHG